MVVVSAAVRPAIVGICAAAAAGCGGGNGAAQAIPGLSVGGSYDTQVSLNPGNTCGQVTVQDAVTVVDHAAGASSLSLTHAGNTYPGTIDRTGLFSTAKVRVAAQIDVSVAGQFGATGFDATTRVDQLSPPCGYSVHWIGTERGAPNTFP